MNHHHPTLVILEKLSVIAVVRVVDQRRLLLMGLVRVPGRPVESVSFVSIMTQVDVPEQEDDLVVMKQSRAAVIWLMLTALNPKVNLPSVVMVSYLPTPPSQPSPPPSIQLQSLLDPWGNIWEQPVIRILPHQAVR